MKKTLIILLLGAVPALALAGGDHAGAHAMPAHDMAGMHGAMHDDDDAHPGAVGKAGNPAEVSRTIELTMDDSMRFVPDHITVKAGETIRFFARNRGKVPHEMVIGSMVELKEHADMMRKMPGMQHTESNMITLKPGQRGGIVWKFEQPGTVDFACLIPGHMEAGMVAKVTVTD